MSLCTKCGEDKPPNEFYLNARGRRDRRCKLCQVRDACAWRSANLGRAKAQAARRYAENFEAVRLRNALWAKENKEWKNKYNAEWRASHPDLAKLYRQRHAAYVTEWHRNHPEFSAAKSAKRRAGKSMATPLWANQFFIKEAYALARLRSEAFGFRWHVDHMVPLLSPIVCGLHCEANLTVIPAAHNILKSNTQWPDMP